MTLPVKRIHFKTIDSTNNWPKNHIDACLKDGITVISADTQTSGRGRLGRKWLSAIGQNVLASFAYFDKDPHFDRAEIVQLLAQITVELLKKRGVAAQIKWPNDVLVQGKKIAGILCETHPFMESSLVIIGIGLNVNIPLQTLQQIDQPATSLLVETKKEHDIEQIIVEMTEALSRSLRLKA